LGGCTQLTCPGAVVVDPAADVAGTLEGEGKFESAWVLDPELITDPMGTGNLGPV